MSSPDSPLDTERVYLTKRAFESARTNGMRVIKPVDESVANINNAVANAYPEFAINEPDLDEAAFVVRWLESGLRRLSKWDTRFSTASPKTTYNASIGLSYSSEGPGEAISKLSLASRKVVEMSWDSWSEHVTGKRLAAALLYPWNESLLPSPGHGLESVPKNVVSTLATSKSAEDHRRNDLIEDISRQYPVAFSLSR